MDEFFNSYKKISYQAIINSPVDENKKTFYPESINEKTRIGNDANTKHLTMFETSGSQSSYSSWEIFEESRESLKSNGINKDVTRKLSETTSSEKINKTIENLSILNLNNMRDIKTNPVDSDTEWTEKSNIAKEADSSSRPKLSLNKLEELRKKPKKNEILNFNIPIYMDLCNRNITIKPHIQMKELPLKQKNKEVRPKIGQQKVKNYHKVVKLQKKCSKISDFNKSTGIQNFNNNENNYFYTITQNLPKEGDIDSKTYCSKTNTSKQESRGKLKSLKQCSLSNDILNIYVNGQKIAEPSKVVKHHQSINNSSNKLCSKYFENKSIGINKNASEEVLSKENFQNNDKEDRLLNINVICQFFPNENFYSEDKASNKQSSSNKEYSDKELKVKQTKEKKNQKKPTYYLTKIFNRTKLK